MASFFTTEAFKEFVLQSKNKSAEDWELYVKTAEFVVYRQKAPGDRNPNLYKYRSIGGWKDIQPETLAHVYLDLAFRSTWDKNMKSHQSFVTDLMQSGNHFEMKYPWPLTNRDYAYTIERRIVKDSEKNEYQVILGESLPDTCFPAVKGVIRIDTYMQNICIGPVKQGQGCTVFMDYFDDPKGNIPSSAINWAAKTGVPNFIKSLKSACLQYQKENPAGVPLDTCEVIYL